MTVRRRRIRPIERQTLTIAEAATYLGISKSTAYTLARQFESTNGTSGLPVRRLGHRLVVPKRQLDAYLDGEP